MNKEIRAELGRTLSKLSGHALSENDYVSRFVNEHGGQLVFVRKQGEGHAILFHSDMAWKPKLLQGSPTLGPTRKAFLRMPEGFLETFPWSVM